MRTSFASGVHSTGTTPCVPAQCAGIISLKTSSRGRSRRGRIYVACVPAGLLDADGARFGTTWAPDVATFFGNFLAELAALPQAAELVVVSRKLGDYEVVADWVGKREIGTIRRRAERQGNL